MASTAPVPTENQPQRDYRGIPKKTKAIIAALISARNTTKITVSRMENFGKKTVGGHAGTIDAVIRVLAQKGVEIIGDDTVKLTKRPRR